MRLLACLMLGTMLLGGRLFAAESAKGKNPAIMQKKVLVVYYSRTGNTKKVAGDIARALDADSEELIDKKDRSGAEGYMTACDDAANESLTELEPVKIDPAGYDLVVLGTPIWIGTVSSAIRTYIAGHRAAFRKIACFTTAAETKPDAVIAAMEELSGKKAAAAVSFLERELEEKNRVRYDEKLKAFLNSLE